MVGQTIGHYRILEKLGQGGMGIVYKAEDTRLNRPVALKVLGADKTHDEERKRRFLQEARAASALNHPNIVVVYDIHEEAGASAIAMEFVPGRTLDKLIGPHGMKLAETLACAVQVADALGRAHAAGIVHRDVKPSNVMVTDEGVVKVVDFGLAKLKEPTESDPLGATETLKAHTAEGTILGTVAYMSPEQAEAKKVDYRSDVFSFGALLYEMVTGRRAFHGDSTLSVLSAILREDPKPPGQLVAGLPRELERIIARCLRKDLRRRYQSMDDVKLELEEVKEEPAPGAAPTTQPARRPARGVWLLARGVFAGLLLAALLFRWAAPEASAPRYTPLATEAVPETAPAWSPDGKSVAYLAPVAGVTQVFARSLASASPVQVTRSRADCSRPFWSPDGARIYYISPVRPSRNYPTASGELWSIGTAGGEPQLVVENAVNLAAMSPDGKTLAYLGGTMGDRPLFLSSPPGERPQRYTRAPFPEKLVGGTVLAFSSDGSKLAAGIALQAGGTVDLWVLPFPSGEPRPVLSSLPAATFDRRFAWLPDGRHVVFDRSFGEGADSHLYVANIETGAVRPLTSGTGQESEPAVSPDGKRIAFTAGTQDFDLLEIPTDGSPAKPLLATSRTEEWPSWPAGANQYAYVTNAGGSIEIWLRSHPSGWARPVLSRGAEGVPDWNRINNPRFAPDGQRMSYELYGAQHLIWISTVAGSRPVRLDSDSGDQHATSWSPDGNWIAYRRLRQGKWELAKAGLGGGRPVRLAPAGDAAIPSGGMTDWSPSGEWIAYRQDDGLHLISPDGQQDRLLSKRRPMYFSFSKDSSVLHVLDRGANRKWHVIDLDVASGAERKAVEVAIPPEAAIRGFSPHPDGKSFVAGVGLAPSYDIWILEGFAEPGGWWSRLRGSR